MNHVDVANGDADGLCALHQLRLAEPVEAELVTGVKRDIALIERVRAQSGDVVTVLDVSLERNRPALVRLLDAGVRVRYFDHHYAGEIPAHRSLEAHIDTRGGTCTSMLVDTHLDGRFRAWAVVAAFGDNLGDVARRLAQPLALTDSQLEALGELGDSMNYNAYGETIADLRVPPAELYRLIQPYADPLQFLAREAVFEELRNGWREDMNRALAIGLRSDSSHTALYELPDEPWSRRVIGALANHLVISQPDRAFAVLAPNSRGGYVVSVRAPRGDAKGAAGLCREYPTGGGRHEAAGIDDLPEEALPAFIVRFESYFAS
ncbi:MAG: acetyltransferase [Betaproteobacteria bacterium]|jgi:single-stranded DNA-specific DHH superfamily exonuclease|nr:acetyltransferase [Betaproteobacteria bacterium]